MDNFETFDGYEVQPLIAPPSVVITGSHLLNRDGIVAELLDYLFTFNQYTCVNTGDSEGVDSSVIYRLNQRGKSGNIWHEKGKLRITLGIHRAMPVTSAVGEQMIRLSKSVTCYVIWDGKSKEAQRIFRAAYEQGLDTYVCEPKTNWEWQQITNEFEADGLWSGK